MARKLLRVATLRSRAVAPRPVAPVAIDGNSSAPSGVSRRAALGAVGLATLGAAPLARAVTAVFDTRWTLKRVGRGVAFCVAGVERWRLHPEMFVDGASVHVTVRDSITTVELRNAYAPGTSARLDVTVSVAEGARAEATVSFPHLGCSFRVPFADWLLGKAEAKASLQREVRLPTLDVDVVTACSRVAFDSSWTFRFEGPTQARLGEALLNADACTFRVLPLDEPSVLAAATRARSSIRLARGHHDWRVPLRMADLPEWTLRVSNQAFDAMTTEVSANGPMAVVFNGGADGTTAIVHERAGLALPLRAVQYAVARDGEGLHEAFVARPLETPQWFDTGVAAFEIADDPAVPPIDIELLNGRVERLRIAPGLRRYAIPVEGVITEPTSVPRGSAVALLCSAVRASAQPEPHSMLVGVQIDKLLQSDKTLQAQIPAGSKKTIVPSKKLGKWGPDAVLFAGNPKITVVRPEDLLILTFEFVGITLNRTAGTFQAGSGAKIIVHFQPQHIAERAFFTADNEPADKTSVPANAKKASSTEPLLDQPIDAVMAHDTRLVFSVKPGHSGQLTIRGLLDWSALDMVVSPSAKPPTTSWAMAVIASVAKTKVAYSPAKVSQNTTPFTFSQAQKGAQQSAQKFSVPKSSAVGGSASTLALAQSSFITDAFEYNADVAKTLGPNVWQDLGALELQKPPIREPNADETAIEYPYRLILSPNKYAGWAHALDPVWNPQNRRAELWHTRLGTKSGATVNERSTHFRTMRAIWSPDYGTSRDLTPPYLERPFRTSLNRRDRSEIVDLTSNYNLKKTSAEPLEIKRFMLTSLGAWANMIGAWDPHADDQLDVEQWIQRGSQGRDHFVRVCYKGFLFPFGHRATLVKETERKFRRTPRGEMAGYLLQRLFIILRQPVRDFPSSGLQGMQYQGRDFPFRSIEITTLSTPNLELPTPLTYTGGQLSANSFWPQFTPASGNKQDVMWTCIGTDWEGTKHHFSTPLVFLANTDAAGNANLKSWIDQRYTTGELPRRSIAMQGRKIAFAPSIKLGDTALPCDTFVLSGYYSDTVVSGTPRFFPSMQRADVRIEQAQELLGTNASSRIEYYKKYLEHAFDPGNPNAVISNESQIRNPMQMFVRLLDPVGLDFGTSTDKAGGLAAPSVRIDALSRLTGPVSADTANPMNSAAAKGKFDPTEYFKNFLETKVLGDIKIIDLLKVIDAVINNIDKVPGLARKDAVAPEDTTKALTDQAKEIKKAAEDAIAAANELPNDIDKDVKDAKDALKAELQPLIAQLNGMTNESKKGLQEEIQKARKKVEDKISELRSAVEKTLAPYADVAHEAQEKYKEAKKKLDALKKGVQLVYEWQTELSRDPLGLITPLYPSAAASDQKMMLYLKASLSKGLDLNPPTVQIFGSISNFIINLIGDGAAKFLIIKFNRLAVTVTMGKKPDVDPDIEAVEFAGPLTFVNKLKDLIPRGGSAGGVGFSFDLNVNSKGITASLTIGLPNVTVGVFSLQNMAFLMKLTIPFDGRSFSAYFAFCTKANPFRLTVMMFAGGGFFGIEVTPAGVKMLEAAFEFGGNFAFDCGVASGGASVMAGIYYKLEQKVIDGKTVDQSQLTGYFRLTGNLSVLGLIRVNLVFELTLTWQDNGKVYGTATIEVEIELLFISFSVGVKVERQLKGSDSDPTFVDMLPQPSLWEEYCECFA